MNRDAERLIRDSWLRVVPIRLTAAQLFYDRLFEIDPSAKALFDGKPMHVQYEKFAQTINTLVQMLDFPANIIDDLQALARRHVGYGVNLEQYASVGAALLWALERGLGSEWTPEVKRAWGELYLFIEGVMKREVSGSPTR
ncbi:globin family protein [Gemmatimonas sp.]|uniref:globin family protein n=1 Tax=Gemmatimonas sp. TaxID=1962908 RepID=UPI00286DB2DB|nr:globin family protein [Gemmatimonas sp.]